MRKSNNLPRVKPPRAHQYSSLWLRAWWTKGWRWDDDPFFAEHEVSLRAWRMRIWMRVFSFLFADSHINTGSEANSLFFISSSFVPSHPSALESNPFLVRVKSKIPGAGLLILSTIRLNVELWMKSITSFDCYVLSDVILSESRERRRHSWNWLRPGQIILDWKHSNSGLYHCVFIRGREKSAEILNVKSEQ